MLLLKMMTAMMMMLMSLRVRTFFTDALTFYLLAVDTIGPLTSTQMGWGSLSVPGRLEKRAAANLDVTLALIIVRP